MSWAATAYVKNLRVDKNGKKLTKGHKLVLFVLADYHNEERGDAWTSLRHMAKESLYSRAGLILALCALEKGGLIHIVRNQNAAKTRITNRYIFPDLETIAGIETRPALVKPVDHPGIETRPALVKPVDHIFPKNLSNQSNQKKERAREGAHATTDGDGNLGRIREIAGRVLDHLNVKAKTQFTHYNPRGRPTEDLTVIEAILRDGYIEADCMRVIDIKVRQWKDTKDGSGRSFTSSLRPSTLFAKSKFSTYLGECPKPLTSEKIIPLRVETPRPATSISMCEALTDRPDLLALLPRSLIKQFDG